LTVSGLEQSGLEALTTPPRTLAIELAVERTFMFRGGAGAMTVSRDEAKAAREVASRLKPLPQRRCATFQGKRPGSKYRSRPGVARFPDSRDGGCATLAHPTDPVR
ncbi:hypothetical protein, partial [uncultured Thiodictyon sp.]|uniref:hypothetical protein n=1 Tax=uncultured Thiodictyon sp. TaxID=1846217 RepID=UPI0025D2879A